MEYLIFSMILFFAIVVVVNYSVYKQKQTRHFHELRYLNSKLGEAENVGDFIPTKRFEFKEQYYKITAPRINAEYLANTYYQSVILSFTKYEKLARNINYILISLIGLLIGYLFFEYPSFLEGVFKNDAPR